MAIFILKKFVGSGDLPPQADALPRRTATGSQLIEGLRGASHRDWMLLSAGICFL